MCVKGIGNKYVQKIIENYMGKHLNQNKNGQETQ